MDYSLDHHIKSIIEQTVEPLKNEVAQLRMMLADKKDKDYLSAKEVQSEYGISRSTLSRHCASKMLQKYQVHGKVYYRREELEKLFTAI